MTKSAKQVIFKLGTSMVLMMFSNNSLAVPSHANLIQSGYWYEDNDIRAVLKSRVGDRAYIAPAVPNAPVLINDVAVAALIEARTGKPALIPVNLNGNHWTALAIRTKANGDIVVFYNDSFGSSVGGNTSESGQYIEAIRRLVPNAQIIDLQVHQQNDGSSCGAFTAENLIAFSLLDETNLTPEAAREALSSITDAKAIRILQLNSLGSLYQKIVTSEELVNSELTKSNIESTTQLAFNETANLSSLFANRLSHLYLADNGNTGISSGEDQLNYGVWVVGSIGNGLFKAKDSSKLKQKSAGGSVGFDSKIDEDTILGIAVSSSINTLKPKTLVSNNSHANLSTNIRAIIGSLYGSIQVDEQLVLSGVLKFGKLYGKTKYQSLLTDDSFKLKGELFGANIGVNYYLPIASVVLVPSIAVSYDGVKFAGIKQGNLSIGKSNIQKFSITPGLALRTIVGYDNFQLMPELFATYSHSPLVKAKKLSIKNASGQSLANNRISISKHSYNLGVALMLVTERIEASIGYERITQSRYLGHTGYLKLRINI